MKMMACRQLIGEGCGMKKTPIKTPSASTTPVRGASDNLCKRLAEEYPQFARWLFGAGGKVKVVKSELSREPIRADAVIFSHGEREILHAEFQTTMTSEVPVPLRLLDYYVGLKRQQPNRRVRQVLVVLKQTGQEVPDRYEDERTVHGYDVVKLWEEDPAVLLKHEGLLPLATLCRTESSEKLLADVAARITRIRLRQRRREALNWSRMLAGLRYDKKLIFDLLKESDMLEESVIYQDIFQKGEQQGLQQGLQEGKRELAMHLLERRVGKLSAKTRRQIQHLPIERIEALCEALLDFHTKADLTRWLKEHAPERRRHA
jgi:predicted transposase YdaD